MFGRSVGFQKRGSYCLQAQPGKLQFVFIQNLYSKNPTLIIITARKPVHTQWGTKISSVSAPATISATPMIFAGCGPRLFGLQNERITIPSPA